MAEIKVTAKPARRGGIRVNGLSAFVKMLVNWYMVGYNETNTTILSTSVIALKLPLSQLLSNIPPKMEPTPIHQNGNAPATNCPIKIWFVITPIGLISAGMISTSMEAIPEGMDVKIIIPPAIIVKLLINPAGVGLVQLVQALSISNALIKNAPPSILTRTAKISVV
ncbi:MAG: hypothetical protein NPMRd3_430001 [Nitrosopumilales archaeon]|nr:MAG: hypothetical protein NPMRd3_430001 [Nitrosopumilales archaeon]